MRKVILQESVKNLLYNIITDNSDIVKTPKGQKTMFFGNFFWGECYLTGFSGALGGAWGGFRIYFWGFFASSKVRFTLPGAAGDGIFGVYCASSKVYFTLQVLLGMGFLGFIALHRRFTSPFKCCWGCKETTQGGQGEKENRGKNGHL
ncbi:MAG: hypothetical protein IJ496_07250, partial [Ruminococcus sp.]|nr:hypothetical protein [Ruminococcus sp.]